MHLLLGCLFTFVFGILLFILVAVFNLLKVFFRVKNATRKFTQNNNSQTNQTEHSQTYTTHNNKRPSGKKIFEKHEGEYVDFEEVK